MCIIYTLNIEQNPLCTSEITHQQKNWQEIGKQIAAFS